MFEFLRFLFSFVLLFLLFMKVAYYYDQWKGFKDISFCDLWHRRGDVTASNRFYSSSICIRCGKQIIKRHTRSIWFSDLWEEVLKQD